MRVFLLLILMSCFSFGQNKKIDSLNNLLKQSPQDIKILTALSGAFENYDIEKSIFYAKKVVNISKIKADDKFLSKSYHNLGLSYFMGNKTDSALVYHKIAYDLSDKKDNNYQFEILVDIANSYFQKREINSSKMWADKAFLKKELIGKDKIDLQKKLMRLYLVYSGIFQSTSEWDKAFENANEALKISKVVKDKKREYRIMNSIANIFDSKGDRKKAIEIYKEIISKVKIGDDTRSNISVWYFNLAATLMKLEKHSEAKVYIDRGLDLIKDENDSKMKAFFSLAKAQISLKENKGLEALSYISVAKTRFTESGITGRLADCFYWETKVYLQNKDYEKATKTINEAIKIYKQNDLKSELKDCYAILSDIMVKQNNYDGALDNYKKYNEVYEDIYTNENLKSIADAEIKYETRIKELKIKTQQLQIKEEKPINI